MGRYIEEDEQGNRYIVDDDEGPIPPFARGQETQLGADYNLGYGENASKAVDDILPGLAHMGSSLYDYANTPESTMARTGMDGNAGYAMGGPLGGFLWQGAKDLGVEGSARLAGPIAAGSAGALSLGVPAAGLGTAVGGPLVGLGLGAVGAGLGAGAGMMGFDGITNFLTGTDKPLDHYVKDFMYNAVQGGATEGLARGAGATARGVGKIADKIIDPFTTAGNEARVVDDLNRMAPGYAEQVTQQLEQRAGDPFLEHKTLSELLDNDILRNVQRSLSKSGLEGIGISSERYKARNDAQLKYLDAIDQSPQTAADAQGGVRSGIEGEFANQQALIDSATGKVQDLTANLPAPIDLAEGGSAARDTVASGLEAQRGIVTQKFTGIGNGAVELAPAREIVSQEMPNYFKDVGAEPNAGLVKLVADLEPKVEQGLMIDPGTGKPITREIPRTMKDVQAIRSKAIEIQKNADPKSARVAGEIIKGLDASVQDAIASGRVTPEEAASWGEGIAARREQGSVFESKGLPAKSVLGKEYSGDYTVQDSAIMSRFWKPGKDRAAREAVQNFKRAAEIASGGDRAAVEAAMEPLQRYAVNSYRRVAVDGNGLVDVKKANAWLDQHSEALKEMPELEAILKEPRSAQKFLNERLGDLKRSKAEVEKGALQFWLKDIPPEKAIKEMLSNSGKGSVKKTKATVDYLKSKKDADALGGLRRGVIEQMKDSAYTASKQVSIEEASLPTGRRFDGEVSDAMLANAWDNIREPVTKAHLFTESQLKNFEYLYKDKQSQLSIDRAKMPGSVTSQDLSVIKALGDMAGTGFLKFVSPKMGSWAVRVLEPMLKQIPAYKYRAIMEQANFNPRYARDLQTRANARTVAKVARDIFAKEIAEATGAVSVSALVTSNQSAPPPKPVIKRQEQVTSKFSFPNPSDLLNPPAKGELRKTTIGGY